MQTCITIQPFESKYIHQILSYQKDLYSCNFKDPSVEPTRNSVSNLFNTFRHTAFVLLDENRLIGFYLYMIGMFETTLAQIYIVEEHRNKGYGKMLMNHFENQLKESGDTDYNLEASCMNDHAIQFYKKLNCQVEEEFESHGEKRYFMTKKI